MFRRLKNSGWKKNAFNHRVLRQFRSKRHLIQSTCSCITSDPFHRAFSSTFRALFSSSSQKVCLPLLLLCTCFFFARCHKNVRNLCRIHKTYRALSNFFLCCRFFGKNFSHTHILFPPFLVACLLHLFLFPFLSNVRIFYIFSFLFCSKISVSCDFINGVFFFVLDVLACEKSRSET